MQNKKLIIAAGAVAVVVVIAIVVVLALREPEGQGGKRPDREFANWDSEIEDADRLTEEAFGLFDEANLMTYEEIIKLAKEGRLRLTSELWRLRRKCPKEMNRYDCNIRIRQFIMNKFPAPGNEKLAGLFRKYLEYEETMSEFKIDEDIPLAERYALIKEKRREIFGDEDAQLVFGLEESKFDFNQKTRNFLKQTEGLSGEERLAKFDEIRKESFGGYYAAVTEAEPKYSVYEREQLFKEEDLGKLSGEEKSAAIRSMREKYFGKDGADRMDQVDRQLAKEKQDLTAYENAEGEFLKNNPGLPEKEREEKLMQLRVQHLGKEEAEAYTRREQYRKSLEKLKSKK